MVKRLFTYKDIPVERADGEYVRYEDYARLETALHQALDLLRGAQTHLLDGDNSIWRRQLDLFVDAEAQAVIDSVQEYLPCEPHQPG